MCHLKLFGSKRKWCDLGQTKAQDNIQISYDIEMHITLDRSGVQGALAEAPDVWPLLLNNSLLVNNSMSCNPGNISIFAARNMTNWRTMAQDASKLQWVY